MKHNFFINLVDCAVGNGDHTYFWNKKRIGSCVLRLVFPDLYAISVQQHSLVGSMGVLEEGRVALDFELG